MKSFLLCCLTCLLCIYAPLSAQNTQPQWRNVAPLALALTGHKAVTLHTGEVLVCGGITASGTITNTSLLYSNGAWIPTNNQLGEPRAYHALIALRRANGESIVLAIGGYTGSVTNASSLASVEVLRYTAATKAWTWSKVGDLPLAVGSCAAAFDKKNSVVVSGGRTQNGGILGSGNSSAVAARINSTSLAISRINDMASARSEHATLMMYGAAKDSTVLSACGESGIPSTEILSVNTWDNRANPPQFQQRFAATITDRAEIARMVGGIDETGVPTNRGEWYDTKSGWRFMPRMQTARARSVLTHIAGLRDSTDMYLICGGQSTVNATTPESEIFNLPDNVNPNGSWLPFAPLQVAAAERMLCINADNLPLVIGGSSSIIPVSSPISGVEMYQPLRAADLNLGQQEIGGETKRQVVKVQNTWYLPVMLRNIRIPNTAEFRLTNSQDSIILQPSGNLDIDVRFRPNSVGQRTAWLYFDVGPLRDSVLLKGEGIKSSIAVLGASQDFGQRLVRTDTTLCFYALRNEGKDTSVIDSVRIEPPGAFTVISPVGSVRVPPGDSLQLCIRFTPNTRSLFNSGAVVHITDRAYPVSLLGKGIRAFILSSQQRGCDTVNIAPGDSLSYTLTISNNSDVAVKVDSTIISTSLAGTFVLKSPSPFPLTLTPGANRQVEVLFKPKREAQEQANIRFINNGDTLCAASLCFIPRNRSIKINTPQTTTPTLCEGDSLLIPIVLENPSSFDSLKILSAQISSTTVDAYILGSLTTSLAPRATTSAAIAISARRSPQQSGSQQATMQLSTNQGTSQYTFMFTVKPGMNFTMSNAQSPLGRSIVIPVRRNDNLNSVNSSDILLLYNGSVLAPRTVMNVNGKSYINTAASTLSREYGKTHLHIVWNSHPATPDEVFAIECDVLLGDDTRCSVSIQSDTANAVCMNTAQAEFNLQDLCGGRNALVTTKNVVLMRLMPNPVHERLGVELLLPQNTDANTEIVIRNVLGKELLRSALGQQSSTIDISSLDAGLYFCELLTHGHSQSTQPITILR